METKKTSDPYVFFLNGHNPEADSLVKMALEDFRDSSGLWAEILEQEQVRMFSGNSDTLKERQGFASINGQPILQAFKLVEFPYFSEKDKIIFYRHKLIPSTENGDGHKIRYLHPLNAPAIPYIPPEVWKVKDKASVPVWITEGEKKTLKLLQHGRFAIGLSGVWNYKAGQASDDETSKFLWTELETFNWRGRTVDLGFDSDLWTNPQVRFALYEFVFKLMARGAIIRFPKWAGAKGIDDYLVTEKDSEAALQSLEEKAVPLEKFICPDHQDEIVRSLKLVHGEFDNLRRQSLLTIVANGLRIPRKELFNEVQKQQTEPLVHPSAYFPGLVDLVINDEGDIAYLVKTGDGLSVEPTWDDNGTLYSPPEADYLPFQVVRGHDVLSAYQAEDIELCGDLIAYLRKFSYLSEAHFLIIALKVFLSYLQDHADVHYLPMILFYASPERGKSRTGKATVYVAFRGIHVVDMREANLFRFSQDLHATIFFDLMNLWKKAEKNGAEDILLLRYEKGAKASRVIYPDRGAFRDMVHYDVFGPTLIATNEAIHNILDTRCISITMPNKPGDYENPSPEKAKDLKIRLTAWRARWMDSPLPEVSPIAGIQGRLWDISKPLLQVCGVVCPSRYEELEQTLLEIAGQRTEDKRGSLEWQIIGILEDSYPEILAEWTCKTADVLDRVNEARPEGHKLSPQYLGTKLRAMGIKTRHVHGHSEIMLPRKELDALLMQFNSPIALEKSLPISTCLPDPVTPRENVGRELVEMCELPFASLPDKNLAREGIARVVESGRELAGMRERKNLDEAGDFIPENDLPDVEVIA